MKSTLVCHLTVVMCLLLCGCHRQEDDNPAVEAARTRFRQIRDSLYEGHSGVSDLFALDCQICGWVECVSNAQQRADLVMELSKIILSIDLEGMPYEFEYGNGFRRRIREFASGFFVDYMKALFRAMGRCGCRPEDTMEFYFRAMQKLRDAWLSIPYDFRRLPGESWDECNARRDAARALQGFYEQEMSEVRRFVLPHLSNYLPEELHDEFRRRIKPFFDFPSKEEFYEMMHPGYKYPYPHSQKPSEKKQETTKPEDAVEVDI